MYGTRSLQARTTPYVLVFLTFLALFAVPARAATVPSGFSEALVASGLSNPTAMQFAPDGRLFVCEQGGRLRVIKDGALLGTPFLTLTVSASGERGLLGVAFDPAFATNKYVYVYYTATTPTVHNRISRFTANGDVAVAGSEVVIFELDNLTSATNHNGGALAFGADGKLYAAVGDNANGSNAQSLGNLLGKILRINKDGSIPADNPFYNTASGRNRAIWAFGLRNPFTFAFNPLGTELFINDVGEATWEEINAGTAGGNFGWPWTEGTTSDPDYGSPRYAYGHGNGTCAITGGAFYSPVTAQFPSDYFQDYFFADHCAGWVRKLDLATNAVVTFATGLSAPVDLKVSDDGALYYLVRGWGSTTGAVYRIGYGTAAPAITSEPASRTIAPGESVTFSVRASGTPPLRYQWRRNGADIAGATSPDYTIAAVSASDNGARFRALVTNDYGNALSAEAVLTVTGNQAPTATIATPAAGTLYSAGSVVNYAGSGSDPEDGTLPPGAYTWRVDFHHDSHAHPFMPDTSGATGGSFTIPTTGETSANVWYRLYLTVRDSAGLTHTATRDILPRKSRLTLTTSPAGLGVLLDNQPVAAPVSFDSVVGVVRNIEAPAMQVSGGTTYEFVSWSDGGAARHDISTPSANTTYTATYRVASGSQAARAVYGLDEGAGTSAGDASGNGHTGVISGASWAPGRFGGGLTFDGADDRVTVAATSLLNLTTGTIEGWVRLDTSGRWHGVIAKGNANDDAAHNYAMEIEPANRLKCVIGNGTSANSVISTTQLAAQQFHHLACTWDGSQLRVYVDGALSGTAAQTITPAGNSSPLYIGQYGGNVDRLDGVVDEVRIYGTALSQAQIQSDMNTPLGSGADVTPPARSSGGPSGTLPAGTSQATLSLQTNENATCRYGTTAGVAYASLPNAFSASGGTTHSSTVTGLVSGQSYAYYVRCRDSSGNANPDDLAIAFAVAPAPRAAYGFEEGSGTTALDASGGGNHGTISGPSWTAPGRFGGALSFDGIDDRVAVASSSSLNLTKGTIQASVRLDATGRWSGIVAKGNVNSDAAHNYALQIDPGNIVGCVIGNGSSSNAVRSTVAVAAGQLYHLACTWDGSQLRLYINGTLNRSATQTITPAANGAPLFIGQYGGNVDRLDGVIDEVRIYDVVLSQAQIQADMNTAVDGP